MSFSNYQKKFSTRKLKEYYPRQSANSKNSGDLRLQVDASCWPCDRVGDWLICGVVGLQQACVCTPCAVWSVCMYQHVGRRLLGPFQS